LEAIEFLYSLSVSHRNSVQAKSAIFLQVLLFYEVFHPQVIQAQLSAEWVLLLVHWSSIGW